MLTTFKHEENRPQEFVGDGNDGALSSSPDQEPLKFGLEGRFGSTGRMGKLAEQTSDIPKFRTSPTVLSGFSG